MTKKTDTSLLHLASRHRFPQAISLLLAQKVDVNAEHPYTHDTALHEALRCQSNDETYQTITLLLNAGADANVENIWGKTPLDFACEHNDKSIVELLLVCESYAEERMLASTSNDIKNLLLQHLPAQRKSWWSAWCCSRNR